MVITFGLSLPPYSLIPSDDPGGPEVPMEICFCFSLHLVVVVVVGDTSFGPKAQGVPRQDTLILGSQESSATLSQVGARNGLKVLR